MIHSPLRFAAYRPVIERRQAEYQARLDAKQNGAEERKTAAAAKRARKAAKLARTL